MQPDSFQKTGAEEITELVNKINLSNMPQGLKEKAMIMVSRVDKLVRGGNYKEYEAIENYINWIIRIPFGKFTKDILDLDNVKNELDSHHYGLFDVKDKILEYLSVFKLNVEKDEQSAIEQAGNQLDEMKVLKGSSANAPVMLFIGIQGIGKTSMAKSIANSLGRQFVRVALGGMSNIHELRGQSRGFQEAEPGKVTKALIDTAVMNPMVLFDEMDKVSTSGGTNLDVMAALLEILDPEQNSTFVDRYIDYPIDISKCMFIGSANNIGGITSALLDRMETVRFTSYNDDDKQQIAKNYLLPKVREATGLGEDQLVFTDDVWPKIIRPLGFDAGVRELERTLTKIARKVAKRIVDGKGTQFTISPANFREYIPDDFGTFA